MTYSTASYGVMIRDARLGSFSDALRRAIEPGVTTVIDIGTGTGIMAFIAASAGARRVVAIEPNPAIEVAREIVRLNGLGDRVELHKAMSTDVDVEPCDVVISDLRGRLPLFESHVPTIIDARERLLVPGGQLIAARDVVYTAPVHAPTVWHDAIGHWASAAAGVDMTPAMRLCANTIFDFDREADDLLAAPLELARIEYATVDSPHLRSGRRFEVRSSRLLHGFSVWFDIELDDVTTLRSGPGEPRLVYGRPFMPLLEPFVVLEGEQVEFELSARFVRGEYVWSWAGGVVGDASRRFEHSTFDGRDVSPADFAAFRLDNRPRRSPRAEWVAFVLERMDGESTLAEIAAALSAAQPEISGPDAVDLVSEVVAQLGRTT